MKFTFKKEAKETGLAGIARPYPNTQIKHNKLVVGYINAPSAQTANNAWQVRIAVVRSPTKEEPAPFKWVAFMKTGFATESLAREAIRSRLAAAIKDSELELYHFDD